jgi:hypothetical protein
MPFNVGIKTLEWDLLPFHQHTTIPAQNRVDKCFLFELKVFREKYLAYGTYFLPTNTQLYQLRIELTNAFPLN